MAAQLEQSRGSQRAFLLSVSHDLRTPLTSIRGYAEALADGTLDDADPDARKRAAAVITAEARRLERLVRDLLDLSRLDSHEFSLKPRPCDFSEIVRDAAEAFAAKRASSGSISRSRPPARCRQSSTPNVWRRSSRTSWRTRSKYRDVVDRDPRPAPDRRPGGDRRRRRRPRHPAGRRRPCVRTPLHGADHSGTLRGHRSRTRDRPRARGRNGRRRHRGGTARRRHPLRRDAARATTASHAAETSFM